MCLSVCLWVCLCVCLCLSMCLSVCGYVYVSVCLSWCVCLWVCPCVYICVIICMYIYVTMYINTLLYNPYRYSRTPILLFDNVYDCQALEHLMSTAGRLPKRPYIISTLCAGGTTCGVPLHQLMFRHNIRLVTCSPQTEPIYGILSRTLRKNLYRLKADPK